MNKIKGSVFNIASPGVLGRPEQAWGIKRETREMARQGNRDSEQPF